MKRSYSAETINDTEIDVRQLSFVGGKIIVNRSIVKVICLPPFQDQFNTDLLGYRISHGWNAFVRQLVTSEDDDWWPFGRSWNLNCMYYEFYLFIYARNKMFRIRSANLSIYSCCAVYRRFIAPSQGLWITTISLPLGCHQRRRQ